MKSPNENGKIRIVIADDYPNIREMVRSVLEGQDSFEVCGEATTGIEAVQMVRELKPDVAVLNITMPKMNGFEAARRITAILPETAIVILSTHADKGFVEEAKKVGARAYVCKTNLAHGLVKTIEEVVAVGAGFLVFN